MPRKVLIGHSWGASSTFLEPLGNEGLESHPQDDLHFPFTKTTLSISEIMKNYTSSQVLRVIQKRPGNSQPHLTKSDRTEHAPSHQNTQRKPEQKSKAFKGLQTRTLQEIIGSPMTRPRTGYSHNGHTTTGAKVNGRREAERITRERLIKQELMVVFYAYWKHHHSSNVLFGNFDGWKLIDESRSKFGTFWMDLDEPVSRKLLVGLCEDLLQSRLSQLKATTLLPIFSFIEEEVWYQRDTNDSNDSPFMWMPGPHFQPIEFHSLQKDRCATLGYRWGSHDRRTSLPLLVTNPQHDPSLNTWRTRDHSQHEKLTSDYPSAIRCAISSLKQRFPSNKRIPVVAKIANDDENSVSSDSEEDDTLRSSLLSFGKENLRVWKEKHGRSKSWKIGPTLKRCGYHKTIQSCNDFPEVIYKWPNLARMRLEAARGNQLRRKRHDIFQKATRDGRKAKFPRQTPYDGHEDLMDSQSYRNQTVDRTIHLVTRNDAEICVCVARLVAKVKISLWETDPRIPWNCATKPLTLLQSLIEDITVNLRLVSYEDLLLLPKFDFWIQNVLEFLKQPRGEILTQEVTRFFRFGSLLDFQDLMLLEILGFLTQGDSNDLLVFFPDIRKNTHHQSSREHGCTSYQFAELISNSPINKNKLHLSDEVIAHRFHKALQMDKSNIDVCQQSRMKQPRTKLEVQNNGPGIKLRSGFIHNRDISLPQALKEYKWLPKSTKRRLRKGNQKEKTLPEKKQAPLPHTIVPKRLAQWRKRKLERGTDPFTQCQTVWKSFSCGHNQRVLCYWCDDAWEKGITVECRLQQVRWREEDTRIRQYRIPYPCSICPWHEYPAFSPKYTWMHRTPVQSLFKPKGRTKPSIVSKCNRSDLQIQQLSFDEEGSHPWELVVRRRKRSRIPFEQ